MILSISLSEISSKQNRLRGEHKHGIITVVEDAGNISRIPLNF